MNEWIRTNHQLPEDGTVVQTKIDDYRGMRNEQPLKRQGRLWFYPDGSMYVYYTPTHWMPPTPRSTGETERQCNGARDSGQ